MTITTLRLTSKEEIQAILGKLFDLGMQEVNLATIQKTLATT